MDRALDEHKEQDLYEPSVQPCRGELGAGLEAGQVSQVPFPATWKVFGQEGCPLPVVTFWWPVFALEEMLVSSSGEISAL